MRSSKLNQFVTSAARVSQLTNQQKNNRQLIDKTLVIFQSEVAENAVFQPRNSGPYLLSLLDVIKSISLGCGMTKQDI